MQEIARTETKPHTRVYTFVRTSPQKHNLANADSKKNASKSHSQTHTSRHTQTQALAALAAHSTGNTAASLTSTPNKATSCGRMNNHKRANGGEGWPTESESESESESERERGSSPNQPTQLYRKLGQGE